MKRIYFTITGTRHRLGQEFLKKGAKVRLEKEPDNKHDHEAIKVTMDGLGHIGYVANSIYTVLGESMSAGRLYDRIGRTAWARVRMVLPQGVICSVCRKSIRYTPPADEPDETPVVPGPVEDEPGDED